MTRMYMKHHDYTVESQFLEPQRKMEIIFKKFDSSRNRGGRGLKIEGLRNRDSTGVAKIYIERR